MLQGALEVECAAQGNGAMAVNMAAYGGLLGVI